MVLGRSAGLSEAQLAHIGDDPLPDGVYDDADLAVLEYTRRSSAMAPIDDELFGRLRRHLSERQVLDLCFTVGLANLVNRFHATFLTDVDAETLASLGAASGDGGSCPIPLPPRPAV